MTLSFRIGNFQTSSYADHTRAFANLPQVCYTTLQSEYDHILKESPCLTSLENDTGILPSLQQL